MALDLVDQYHLSARTSCFVGDSEDDAEAAEACGMPFWAVCYGFGEVHKTHPHCVLETFPQVLEHFC